MIAVDEPNLPGEILNILHDLGASLTHHSNWMKRLHRTLVCGAPPAEDDLSPEAHHRCQFGRWYYGEIDPCLKDLPQYAEVGELHRKVHETARDMLWRSASGQDISTDEYDGFIDIAHRFRVAVEGLQFAMISHVCAVDHLTGVWNRYALTYKLSQEHERVRRTRRGCAVAIIDFDHFKKINDEHGHLAGDKVLKTAIQYFAGQLRRYDAIFRYGGEEFLLVFPETDLTEAAQILDRLREDLKRLQIPLDDGHSVQVSVSIGLASLGSETSIRDAIEMADKALLNAKLSGRDTLYIWS